MSQLYTVPNRNAAPVPKPRQYPPLAWNISVAVERYLSLPGEVLVSPGARVESDTPLARTLLPGSPSLFNLAEFFGLPAKEVKKLLLKKEGDPLTENTVLAQKKGFGGKTFRAPFDGTLAAYDDDSGYVSLAPTPKPFTLEAYVRGTITDTIYGFGAKIETQANFVRGAFGVGGERHGVLRRMVEDSTKSITPDMLDARSTYFILLGGMTVTAETLKKAVDLKVRGLITGSIREEELSAFLQYRQRRSFYQVGQNEWRFPADINSADSPLTLILTEGFGQRPMAAMAFDLLAGHDGLEISITGQTSLRRNYQRPEIIAPLGQNTPVRRPTSLQPADLQPRPNSLVRLTNPSYLGVVARVISLPQGRRALAPDRTIEVEVGGGRRIPVPVADIELLEP